MDARKYGHWNESWDPNFDKIRDPPGRPTPLARFTESASIHLTDEGDNNSESQSCLLVFLPRIQVSVDYMHFLIEQKIII